MRCWRIMTLAGVVEAEEDSSEIIDGETTVIADRYVIYKKMFPSI